MVDRLFDEVIFMLKEKKNYAKCDWDRVRQLRDNTSWTFTVNENVDCMWDELYSKIMNIVDFSVPVMVQKCTSDGVPIKKAPWESSKLRRSRKSKDKAWNIFDSSPTSINFRKAIDTQYLFEQAARNAKSNYEQQLAQNIKHNPKKFYSYLRSKRKVNKSVGSVVNPVTGNRTDSPSETAQVFVDYFSSVFKEETFGPLTEDCYDIYPGVSSISDFEIDESEVKQLISTVHPFKSLGPDEIHPRILQTLGENPLFTKAIVELFKSCVRLHKIPTVSKYAILIALHKKGPVLDSENYRPVSLTCILSKVYEKLLRKHMLCHVARYISPSQHGFVEGRSCLSNLLETLNEITRIMESGDAVDIIYLDFRKAFDSVSHGRLLIKLQKFGIVGNLLKIVEDFLSDRWMAVRVGSATSSWKQVTSGVPQGSVLGPLLFLLYVNDLPNAVSSTTKLFADDVKLIGNAESPDKIQEDLNSLADWEHKWCMSFNVKKLFVKMLNSAIWFAFL